jgi:hypothetical protein
MILQQAVVHLIMVMVGQFILMVVVLMIILALAELKLVIVYLKKTELLEKGVLYFYLLILQMK